MQLLFTSQFAKDIRKVRDKSLARDIEDVILEVKRASNLSEKTNLKKLKGYQNAYRIRIRDYRIGIYIGDQGVEFACFINRKDIYKHFP